MILRGSLLKSVEQNTTSAQYQPEPALRIIQILAFFNPNSTGQVGNRTDGHSVVSLAVRDNIGNISSAKKYVEELVNKHKTNNPNFQSKSSPITLADGTIAENLTFSIQIVRTD